MSIEASLAKYPRVGSQCRLKETSQAKCWICGERATHRVDIEVSWFRGDDEVVKACLLHRNIAVNS